MRAENQQRRSENHRTRNLMCPGCLAPALAEMHWCVVSVSGEIPSERQGCVVSRSSLHAAVFKPAHRLAGHFIGPGARFPGRLVRAMKFDHDPMFRSGPQQSLIKVNDLLRLMIEEIDLGSHDAYAITKTEEAFTRSVGAEILTVLPEPNTDLVLF